MMSPSQGISIKNLRHEFGKEIVLDDLTHEFPANTLTAILGPSGCGKTTLLRCTAGLLKPTSGEVMLDGSLPEEARNKGLVGFAFQSPTLLPWRSALTNVLLPLEILHRKTPQAAAKEKALELLGLVNLGDAGTKLPRMLSGGMQQRVSLARSLVTDPAFLFLDEPFGALDNLTRWRLNQELRDLWESRRQTLIFVTHSVQEAIFLADAVVVLTRRPARIKRTITINLGDGRDLLQTRTCQQYYEYEEQLNHLVGEEGDELR